jgi:enoyl-[acyl-carrier protein] reductase II
MLRTSICDLLGINYPVIQGGMAHLGTAELVSAVSNAGGLGIIGTGYYEPDWVRDQIERTREKTERPFGINIQLRSPHIEQVVRIILEERIKIITTGAGNPARYMPDFKQAGIKVIPVIAGVSSAVKVQEVGADAVVAEGMESAGHIGETTTMALVPQVVDSVRIPVIAAGGIADGRGLAAALALGAKGVQMGTVFACSQECIAHPEYKKKILEANDRSTVITGRTTGLPLRSLKNSLTEQYTALEEGGATPEELDLFGQGRMYLGLIDGDVDEGSLLAGQISGMIKEVRPVKDIIEEIVAEAETVITNLSKQTGG